MLPMRLTVVAPIKRPQKNLQVSPVAPALQGCGTLTATTRAIYPNTTTLTGDGALSAPIPAQIYAPPALLAGGGVLSAPFSPYLQAAGGLAGDGALAGGIHPVTSARPHSPVRVVSPRC
jgi:hypothetical protein